jgi:hypothetical protein
MKKNVFLFVGTWVSFGAAFVFFDFSPQQTIAQEEDTRVEARTAENSTDAAKRGIESVTFLLEISEQESGSEGDFVNTFLLMKQMDSVLGLNVREEILRSHTPKETYDEIENRIDVLQKNGSSYSSAISDYVASYNEEITSLEEKIQQTESAFFSAVDTFDSRNSDRLLEQFITEKSDMVRLRAERSRASNILKKLTAKTEQATLRLNAIRRNKEALIAGVQFDARTARSLGLIKENE